jgi:AcrR family transcriptional regulator
VLYWRTMSLEITGARDDADAGAATPTRRTRKRTERRERVFDAAVALFVERGFDATSMDDIARCSGYARSTVFKHFPRKVLFLEEWMRRRRSRAAVAVGSDALAGRPLDEVLGAYLAELVRADAETRIEMRALMPATLQYTTALVDHPLALEIERLVVGTGAALAPSASPERVGRLLTLGYVSAVARWVAAEPPEIDLGTDLAALLDVVLRGALAG